MISQSKAKPMVIDAQYDTELANKTIIAII